MATILVADDDQLLRAIIRDQLERADFEVLEAGDGMAALDIALEERPEVLLLDVMMPLARGLEVVRRVRQQEAWHPAIVMISARTRVTDRLNALEAGADAYVEKPFAPDDLVETITRLLTGAEPARYVDVLGPVWATLALERLADDAISRRTQRPSNAEQVETLFADIVAQSVGRMPGPAPVSGPAADAMRMVWEDAIRALLRDSAEPVPVVTDVTLPDALAAVERTIGDETLRRHRAQLGAQMPFAGFGNSVLLAALAAPAPREPRGTVRQFDASGWTTRLRAILEPEDAPAIMVATWSGVLSGVMNTDGGSTATVGIVDPLATVWLAGAASGAEDRVMR